MKAAQSYRFKLLRSYHLLSGTLLGFLSLILPRRKRIIFNSSLNRFYNFNTKYLFEYFLAKNDVPVFFVIDDEQLREELRQKHGDHFISSIGLKNKLFILCSAAWVTSTMETPVGGVFLSLRRFVYHLGHGVPIKRAGSAEREVSWYKKLYYLIVETNFSEFLAPTEESIFRYQEVYGCSRQKMVVNPQPRLSTVFDESRVKKGPVYKVIYAPTWRDMSAVNLFPFKDYNESELVNFLEEVNMMIYLHPHPIRASVDFSGIQSERLKVVFDKKGEDVTQYLNHYDAIITDYSSIFVEFIALKKPVMFLPYDLESFEKTIGMFDINDLSVGPGAQTQVEFIETLRKFRNGVDEFALKRENLSKALNGELGRDALEINYRYIMKKIEGRSV